MLLQQTGQMEESIFKVRDRGALVLERFAEALLDHVTLIECSAASQLGAVCRGIVEPRGEFFNLVPRLELKTPL